MSKRKFLPQPHNPLASLWTVYSYVLSGLLECLRYANQPVSMPAPNLLLLSSRIGKNGDATRGEDRKVREERDSTFGGISIKDDRLNRRN